MNKQVYKFSSMNDSKAYKVMGINLEDSIELFVKLLKIKSFTKKDGILIVQHINDDIEKFYIIRLVDN